MTLQVRVDGGTGAGKRLPLAASTAVPWRCQCLSQSGEELRPATWINCPFCGARRTCVKP